MTSGGVAAPKRAWAAAAAVLVAAAAAALSPVPYAAVGSEAAARPTFAALASGAIVAVAILPFMLWRGSATHRIWIAVATGALVFGVAAFYGAAYAQRACTTRYSDKAIVIGTELTTLGATYKQANPELTTDDLLFDAAGVPERIWTPSSIARCRGLVGSTYFLWIPFLVVCLLASALAVPTAKLAPVRWSTGPVQP
jgi:hypothetical protein